MKTSVIILYVLTKNNSTNEQARSYPDKSENSLEKKEEKGMHI